jgi:hypothetical protein
MHLLHPGLMEIFAFRQECKKTMQANRKFLHPGGRSAKSALQVSAKFAFLMSAEFARDSY